MIGGADACRVIAFAHRGARARAPENTIEAFSLALELGATGIESDVWITADGVAVLDHDGEVGEHRVPIAQVAQSELPAQIPTLHELYVSCGTDFELSLDLKDPDAIVEVVEVASAHRALDRLWAVYEAVEVLAEWRARWPRLRLVHTTSVVAIPPDPTLHAGRLAEIGIQAVNLRAQEWNAGLVDAFHAEGRLCFAWDAQDSETMRKLLDLGVDALYSDHVGAMVAVLSEGR